MSDITRKMIANRRTSDGKKDTEEALKQDSDISDADPQALLESLMDLDDMDAEIFGPRKLKSDPPKDSRLNNSADPLTKTQDKRTGPKIDPKYLLDDLLLDEDRDLLKMSKATYAVSELTPSKPEPVLRKTSDANPIRSPAKSLPASRRRDDLDFDEDGDDIMNVLGFDESQQILQKKNGSTVRPARSKLDELLGRETSPKLLKRLPPGEKKEFKLDHKYQKMSGIVDPLIDEDTALGSYLPTMTMNVEGRPTISSSVRFFKDAKEDLKSDATPVVHDPNHGVNGGADWLGLRDEDIPDLSTPFPLKELSAASSSGHPASEPKRENIMTPLPGTNQTTPQANHKQTTAQPSEKNVVIQPKDETAKNDDQWLISALAHKKVQKQEKTEDRSRQKERSRLGYSRTTLPWESPGKVSNSISPAVHREKESFETVLSGPTESPQDLFEVVTTLPKAIEEDKYSQRETLQLQNRVLDLEAQVRKLKVEMEQKTLLLESLQKRHKEDLELIENAQRNRLKLLEDSAYQREEHLHKENQELFAKYLSLVQSAENEKSELLSKYQLKLTEFQQEKDKEVERIRELQRLSVQEMCKDHQEQLHRIKCLKDQEIDAVTSASSKTRSLNGIIEQMEAFSYKLNDLAVQVERSHLNTSQEIEFGARQREGQFRALQERLTQHQKDMEEERNSLHMIISNMDARLSEQRRLLEEERWKASAEQTKMAALQSSLDEQKRIMTQQMAREREELEKAKSGLLEEQQSVMTYCAEERRKLAAEWAELHTQQKLRKERAKSDINREKMAESQREGALLSIAKEQAELKVQATELHKQEEQLAAAREALEKERHELRHEKDRVFATAMHVRQRAEEVESMSKMALQHRETGEKALAEAKKVEYGHQERLRAIQQQLDRLKQQEEHLLQEHKNIVHLRRQLNQLRHGVHSGQALLASKTSDMPSDLLSESLHLDGMTFEEAKKRHNSLETNQGNPLQTSDIYPKLTLLKLSAQQDRNFLEDEQLFLNALKRSNIDFS